MRLLIITLTTFFSLSLAACPFCKSPTATQIRASLFGPDLSFNLFVTILPFAIFALIALFIYHGGRNKATVKHKPV